MRQKGLLQRILSEDSAVELLELHENESFDEYTCPDDEECGSLKTWTGTQETVGTPMAVLSSRLTIRWRNAAFKRFRETPGLEYRGRPFHALFSNFAEEENRQKLIEALKSVQTGFSWQGRVEGRGPDGRHFIADLTIIPMDLDGGSRPSWYLAQIFDVTDLVKSIIRANFDSILQASLLKDEDTGNHAERVNAYSRLLAAQLKGRVEWLDVDDDYIENIGFLAAFHDVGKIGTPESILMKNGKLTDEEWRAMKEHPINGALILDAHPSPMAKRIARSHHEHWDGTGYPFGLAGEDIPLEGRIVTIADVYDALRTRRPYKEPFSEEKTVSIIQEGAGTHFDPSLFREFVAIREQFDAVFRNLSDETP